MGPKSRYGGFNNTTRHLIEPTMHGFGHDKLAALLVNKELAPIANKDSKKKTERLPKSQRSNVRRLKQLARKETVIVKA